MSNYYESSDTVQPVEKVEFPIVAALVAAFLYIGLMTLVVIKSGNAEAILNFTILLKFLAAFFIPYILALMPALIANFINSKTYKENFFKSLKYCLILFSSFIVIGLSIDIIYFWIEHY